MMTGNRLHLASRVGPRDVEASEGLADTYIGGDDMLKPSEPCKHPDGCSRPARAAGWCVMHYTRITRHGDPGEASAQRNPLPETCAVDNCTTKPLSRGYCSMHYHRFMKTGSTDSPWRKCQVTGCPTRTRGNLGLCQVHAARHGGLQQKYGISLAEYDDLSWKQGGMCAICGVPELETLHVDHDHETGAVRGLLCRSCNLGIGHISDPDHLRNAARYLTRGDNKT